MWIINYFIAFSTASSVVKRQIISYYKSVISSSVANPEAFFVKKLARFIGQFQGGGLDRTINGYAFYINYFKKKIWLIIRNESTSDFGIFKEIFLKNEYEILFRNFSSNNSELHIVDAGGNIGLFTCLVKVHFPASQIIYIEPDILAYNQAAEIFKLNNFNNIQTLQAALWYNNSFLKIVNETENYEGNASFRVEETNISNDIKGMTLGSVFEFGTGNLIDILKVDIEGAEKHIFTLNNFNQATADRIRFILIEIHDHLCNVKEIVDCILERGFAIKEQRSNVYLFYSLKLA